VAVKQEVPLVPTASKELRPHRMAVGLYDLKNGKVVCRKSVELDVTGAMTTVDALAGEKTADLVVLNDRDLSYGKLRFDDRSIATLKDHLGDIQDPLTRALAWSATWDMLRDGELAASDYVPMAIKALAGEDDVAVVSMTLTQLGTAVELYAADKNREGLRKQLADGVENLLNGAAAASDLQLQYARTLASTAVSDAQVARIREFLDGKLAGLTVDADLRWHFLGCLVERNKATIAEVEKELESDKSANGEKAAAFARAAVPTADAKKAAFELATSLGVSNHIQIQTIQGFNRPGQRELTAPYASKYFEMVLDYWNNHTFEFASNFAALLYPSFQVSKATLDATEGWLSGAGKDAPHGLRRVVSEQRDALSRALKAQAKDN
jgi:aminopeptidase N